MALVVLDRPFDQIVLVLTSREVGSHGESPKESPKVTALHGFKVPTNLVSTSKALSGIIRAQLSRQETGSCHVPCDIQQKVTWISCRDNMNNMDITAERVYPTPYANHPLLPLLILSLMTQRHTPKPSTTFQNEYDYVVVGAGSAGSVVASRLSEEKCVTVLLLEAGKPAPVLTEAPGLARDFFNTDVDWQYKTVPQKHTGKLLRNREVPWPGGKGLGGSGILNAMVYTRGNRKNYDDWAAQGAEGWSFNDVWPYFLKLENNTDPEYLTNGYHAANGPVTFHKPRYEAKIKKPILEAVKEAGYSMVDPNGLHQTGFYDFQATLRDGQRCNSAKAYLVPAENRTNLDILPYAHVRKVVLEGNKATAVEFDHNNTTHRVKVRREVIMAAGAVNTAQLLMLSGIGPREHLEEMQIPVAADLPVGNNFQDHACVPMTYELDNTIPTIHERIENFQNTQEYIHNRTGPLSSTQFISLLGFLDGESNNVEEDFPSSQIYFLEITTKLTKAQVGLRPEVYDQVFKPYDNKPLLICGAHTLQPKSRGTIRLRSSNPYDSPLIDPNYFEDPKDIQETIKGLKVCHMLSTSEPMRKLGTKPLETPIPGCEDAIGDVDRFLECLARGLVITMSHPVGTAKMGDPSDPTTVVDPQLKVKGVEGLRVVDASVMPIIPSANMNTPTIMVAEKASDIIKQTIHCPKPESENSIHVAVFEHSES
ncbi:glucose dehydrogenase [FAD, quinone]-like [Argiope bruennichi]|uniref:glucose dehydrogenase [FAD, quinone]-like n=1 Tax=Argiope bruennichi TaxID=94029 RepID=UPI002494F223|nr:glucose dehydrogenase [FAD, quinone]-like [Argiope bruennichi]